ncbi:TY1B-A [Symbiodinium sp. CCMP2592]|nr:TY1B-A [Symbiodinium sp. CCMP2592]
MLLALPNTYTKERLGAKLLEYISGEAEEVCESVPLEKLTKDGGHELIFQALDERYRELDKEALHKHLSEYFYGTAIRSGETFRNMTVRLDTAYRRLQGHKVELPSEVRGWFLLRKLQLDQTSEAMILTHTKGSLKYEDVNKAIQAIFPSGSAKSGAKVKEVYEAVAEPTEHGAIEESEESIDEVFQAVADQVQATDEYEDEDALDVFETYKEIRKRMQEKKMGRGYRKGPGPTWALTGTVKGKIEALKGRTRCHLCQEKGHWKRECPKRASSSAAGQRSGRAGASNDAMVADSSGIDPTAFGGEYFIEPEDIENLEIFLAERDGEVDVVVANREEAIGDQGEVRGDFERDLRKFFKLSGQSDDKSDSEAYVSECAGLAEHRVRLVKESHEFKFGNAGYGIKVKLRETERGHYAIPLFEGFKEAMCKKGLARRVPSVASFSGSMSYTGGAPMDIPMEGFTRTPLINDLLEEVATTGTGDQMSEIHSKILDEAPDHSDDEPEGIVPGVEGQLGRLIFNVGKYQKAGQLVNFRTAYATDKKYVAWIRKFIKSKTDPVTGKGSHPTMVQFRLYVALRDQRKAARIHATHGLETPVGGLPSASSDSSGSVVTAEERLVLPKARAKPKAKQSATRSQGPMVQPAMMTRAVLPRQGVQSRQMVQAEEEALSHQLEELEEEDPIDVLMLEKDPDEQILTAVGLSSSSVFESLEPTDIRQSTALDKVLAKIRELRPRLLVIRTPDHMTRTKGGKHMARTFHARHRAAFTKFAVACCAEQLCEGRLFCIEEVNDSMSERVQQWKRLREDERVIQVARHDDDSSWRLHTNSQHVREQFQKMWLNQREWRDPRGFVKDVATSMLREKQAVSEVHVAHCVYAIEDLRRESVTILRRCHENLGHPSPARMNMLLKAAHASERVMQLARSLECETCSALSKPKSHNVTKLRRATEFNQQLCVDTFELEVRNSKLHFLNIVDEATGYQLCIPLWKGMQARVVRNAYRKGWKRWGGAPVRLFSDGGKEFEGEFEHGLSLDGTYGDISAAYAPWQNGTAERKGDVWKTAYAKCSMAEAQELIDQINNAVNSMSRKDGYSPHQHVFGRDIRIPGMITSDPDPVVNSSLAQGESVFERRMNIRTAARKAFLEADGEAMVRLLPEDMIHVRDNVSARGAGNYHDLSNLEVPPGTDSTDGQPELKPLESELPVERACLGDRCRVVAFVRDGGKVAHEYDWRGTMQSCNEIKGLWTGTTEFDLVHDWRWNPKQLECFEVKAKKGRKELHESEVAADRKPGLDAAKTKEWKKLVSSGAIVVHDGRKARRLRESVEKKRILKSRFVITEADQGSSPQTQDIKARWCIRGYLDPDLLELDTSAPTLTMEGFAIAMQLIASNGWSLNIADVEGAFLRGDSLSPSRGRLFIDPPPGGVPGLSEGCLIEAVKTVYGLADAPKAWWECFSVKLTSLGMRVSKFDPCLFYYYVNNTLSGVVSLHVDDLCLGGDKHFHEHVIKPLKEMFPFKHWKVGQGEFLGKQLKQQTDGSIIISQGEYAAQQRGLEISRERRREKSEKISEEERAQMRGVLGSINWLVTGSRPDLGAWCSLLQQRVNEATVADLIEVNKLVSLTHDNCKAHAWIKSIPVSDVQFVMLSDAAWANAQGLCSQAGYLMPHAIIVYLVVNGAPSQCFVGKATSKTGRRTRP